jgi:hypothetical protein
VKKIKIDGQEFEVADQVEARIETLEGENETKTKEIGKVEGERDGLQATIDTLKGELKTAQENPKLDSAKIDQEVAARLTLINDAAAFGVEVKTDGTEKRTSQEIRIDCIKKVKADFSPEGKSPEYIEAYFDSLKGLSASETSTGENQMRFSKDGINAEHQQ